MNGVQSLQTMLADIGRDHRELQASLLELKRTARWPDDELPHREILGKLLTMLCELRRRMDTHFALEAAGGLMEEAVARLPRLGCEAAAVEREHPQLLQQIDEIIELIRIAPTDEDRCRRIRTAIENFATRMLRHETAETRLLQQGFNEDLQASGENAEPGSSPGMTQ